MRFRLWESYCIPGGGPPAPCGAEERVDEELPEVPVERVRPDAPPKSENPEDLAAVEMENAVLTTLSPSDTPVRISVLLQETNPVVTGVGTGRPFFHTRTVFLPSLSEIAAVGTMTTPLRSSVTMATVAVMLL